MWNHSIKIFIRKIFSAFLFSSVTTITDLPNSILVHILSFLPTEDAVRTVLIRGLGDLWRAVPVPRDLSWDRVNDGVLAMIRQVLNLHDSGTLDKLCIRLVFPKYHPFHKLDGGY